MYALVSRHAQRLHTYLGTISESNQGRRSLMTQRKPGPAASGIDFFGTLSTALWR